MYFDYDWVKQYLKEAPSLEEAARLLNSTGLETEVDGEGLEVEHTVNRPDAMCHFGIAREIAVKTGKELIHPEIETSPKVDLQGWQVDIRDAQACPQYICVKVDNVVASPSPDWLKKRLTAIGQTSHNILVDLSNFLLWEMGQPCHAFDSSKITGRQIIVRRGEKGEKLTTLDGRLHQAEGLLCIADTEKPIAFGAVMGGENSEVDETTTSLLLELAAFDSLEARKTGRACNIESDARHRYERGIDRERMEYIVRRFLYLLKKEQPEVRIVGWIDMNCEPFKRVELQLRKSRLAHILGIELEDAKVQQLLESMDFKPIQNESGWRLSVPGYKVDVTREVDVIEEIIRFAGLDLLNSELPPGQGSDYDPSPLQRGITSIRRLLVGAGCHESCTYSFISEAMDADFPAEEEPIRLQNPLSEAQNVMRRNILPSLVDAIKRNLNRGLTSGLSLFEMGHVYHGSQEPHHLAIAHCPATERQNWWEGNQGHPFYHLKGMFELLSDRLGWSGLVLKPGGPGYLNPNESLGIYQDEKLIGGFGSLADVLVKSLDISAPLVALEIDLSFMSALSLPSPDIEELSPHPAMQYDMAFVLEKSHSYQAIQDHLHSLEMPNLEHMQLFDAYEGKSVGPNKRSLGIRFRFRAPDRTLTSEEVSQTMESVVASVSKTFGATIRT